MLNKRGDTNTLWIVVGLVAILLVFGVTIAGFSLQWGNFATWLKPDNIVIIQQKCIDACVAQNELDYCLSPVSFKTSAYRIGANN
ncbi:MAG TPA: hypothetical protein PLK34_00450, partial [Candidatus Pacearchaeota archaeon]|nr:hypothetical protein [Candidatus Pacearchaeota archaeon]